MRIFTTIFLAIIFLTGCTSNGKKEPYIEANSTQTHEAYVGAESCKECHQEEYADWKKSDHFYLMQKATKGYVKAAFNRALKMDSLQVSPYTNLAILYSGKNDLMKVKSILSQGIHNFPGNAQLFYFTGLNEGALGNEKVQIENLKRAYEIETQNVKYAYNYILTLYNSGGKDQAKKTLSQALKLNPQNQRLEELHVYFDR